MLNISWTARKTNKSVHEEIRPQSTYEAPMLKQKPSYFGHITNAQKESLEKSTMMGVVREEEEQADLECAGWMG